MCVDCIRSAGNNLIKHAANLQSNTSIIAIIMNVFIIIILQCAVKLRSWALRSIAKSAGAAAQNRFNDTTRVCGGRWVGGQVERPRNHRKYALETIG